MSDLPGKPREFWIEIGNECDIAWQLPVEENNIHVVEFSAVEKERLKVQKLTEVIRAYQGRVEYNWNKRFDEALAETEDKT